jgi:prevent-host-death family protein
MPVIGVREFARNVSQFVTAVAESREPAIITRHGRAVAVVVPMDAEAIEDFVLAHAPDFVEDMRAADEDLAAGRTKPFESVLAELEGEHAEKAADDRTAARR